MTLLLTTDELRVSAAINGGQIPEALRAGWSAEDIPVADVVALRGLLARGLATAHDTEVELASGLDAAVLPLLTADTLVDVQRDAVARPGRWLIAANAGGVVRCAEQSPDLWCIETDPEEPIERMLTELLGHLPDQEPSGATVTLPTDLLVEAERRSASSAEHLQGMLAKRGMRPADADLVADIVCDLQATVTVRSLHRDGSTTTSSAALTWLETASTGVWLAIPVDAAQRDDEIPVASADLATHTELRSTGRRELHAEVRDVLGELTVGRGR
jgi:hypothetical protein